MAQKPSVEKKGLKAPTETIAPEKLMNKKYYRTINVEVTLEDERNIAATASNDMAEAQGRSFRATKQTKSKSVETDIDLMKLAKISNPNAGAKKKTDAESDKDDREGNYKAMLKGMGFNLK